MIVSQELSLCHLACQTRAAFGAFLGNIVPCSIVVLHSSRGSGAAVCVVDPVQVVSVAAPCAEVLIGQPRVQTHPPTTAD